MGLAVWISLAFLVVALIGAPAYAGLRAWRAWREFRGTSGRVTWELTKVTGAAEAAERHAVGLAGGNERLAAAIAQLQRSLAELAVLRGAFAEAQSLVALMRGAVPGK